jgi:hypothetical protein
MTKSGWEVGGVVRAVTFMLEAKNQVGSEVDD